MIISRSIHVAADGIIAVECGDGAGNVGDKRIYWVRSEGRTSLVAQWLRTRLLMQGIQVQALVREDPTCCGATKPVCHNY